VAQSLLGVMAYCKFCMYSLKTGLLNMLVAAKLHFEWSHSQTFLYCTGNRPMVTKFLLHDQVSFL